MTPPELASERARANTSFARPATEAARTSSVGAEAGTGRWLRVAVLALALPLFAQTFHYVKDLPPLWALSKAFPVLCAPLAVALLWRRIAPDVLAWVGGFLWLALVPSVTAMFAFDQSFFAGLTAQVKLLGMLHTASFLGLLLILRPSFEELSVVFGIWAGLIAFALVALWALAPISWYATGYEFGDAPLLSVDHRGPRIRMPMYFVLIGLFFALRRLISRVSAGDLCAFLLALSLAIFVVKTRALVAASLGTLAVVLIGAAKPSLRIALLALALVGAIVFWLSPLAATLFDGGLASGADIRLTTLRKAIGFLADDPVRWLLGVGTFSPFDPGALPRFFNHFFFLSDIGWVGIVFEFGLIGAAILLTLLARVWWMGHLLLRDIRSPFVLALQDYVVFVLLISPLYPTMTLQPGEVATIAAIFIYGVMVTRENPALARSGQMSDANS